MPDIGRIPPELEAAFASTRSIYDQMSAISATRAPAPTVGDAETDAFTDYVLQHVAPNLAAWNRAFPRPRVR